MTASEWRQGSLPAPRNIGTGGEQIARAAEAQIMANIEYQCEQLEIVWANRDADWAQIIMVPYKPTRITRPKNYFLGTKPSLVAGKGARFDLWPAVTVRADQRKATVDLGQFDQTDSYDVTLVVEALTLAGPFDFDPLDNRDASDAVDRQWQRLSDAIIGCIDTDRTLGGNIFPLQRPATVIPSLPFVNRENKGTGNWLVYQAAELSWVATSLAF